MQGKADARYCLYLLTRARRYCLCYCLQLEEAKAQGKADAAKAIKDECEADLSVAMPILNEALAALDTIKEADITYIKKLGNPPAAIKLTLIQLTAR